VAYVLLSGNGKPLAASITFEELDLFRIRRKHSRQSWALEHVDELTDDMFKILNSVEEIVEVPSI
jgi:hypothetical protein